MTNAFPDFSNSALLIGPERPGTTNAGFFFWEDNDMNRARTNLAYPFDAPALVENGPVITIVDTESDLPVLWCLHGLP